jgi:hypothetical protein
MIAIKRLLTTNHAVWRNCVVGVVFMKKLVVTAVALIALVSVSGCVGIGKGKGKAPPPIAPPIMTKG